MSPKAAPALAAIEESRSCLKSVCPQRHRDCLRQVEPERVAEAALGSMQERAAASSTARSLCA